MSKCFEHANRFFKIAWHPFKGGVAGHHRISPSQRKRHQGEERKNLAKDQTPICLLEF